MAQRACRAYGRSWHPCERLLGELSELTFGAKCIEQATGADLEAGHGATESGGASGVLPSKASKPGRKLCCALGWTGVPALPRETAGRSGKDSGSAERQQTFAALRTYCQRDTLATLELRKALAALPLSAA